MIDSVFITAIAITTIINNTITICVVEYVKTLKYVCVTPPPDPLPPAGPRAPRAPASPGSGSRYSPSRASAVRHRALYIADNFQEIYQISKNIKIVSVTQNMFRVEIY